MKFSTRVSRFAWGLKKPPSVPIHARCNAASDAVAAPEPPSRYASRLKRSERAWSGRNGNETRWIRSATGAGRIAASCPSVQGSTKRMRAPSGNRVASC